MKKEILIADNIDNIYDEINALIRENTTLQLFHKKYRTVFLIYNKFATKHYKGKQPCMTKYYTKSSDW